MIIGKETEYNKAENNPAVVPPMTRTKAKITIADKEPKHNWKQYCKIIKTSFNHQKSNMLLLQLNEASLEMFQIHLFHEDTNLIHHSIQNMHQFHYLQYIELLYN